MIDAAYLEAHRTSSSLRVKRGSGMPDRAHDGGMNAKLHAVSEGVTPCIPGRKIRNKAVKHDSVATNTAIALRSCAVVSRRWTVRGIAHKDPARRHTLRSVRERLLLRRSPRRYRYLLALINGT